MTNQNPDRPRIYSHITKTRFLHIEDSLEIGKVRFFIGEYKRGAGAQSTAYHFLDIEDARVICADLGWGKAADFVDFKGTPNGEGKPISRVLKIKGPKDGKYWFQIDNGPGQIIGEGAIKPAGDPDASISIALEIWEARKLALAISEYCLASAVAAMISPAPPAPAPPSPPPAAPSPAPPAPAPMRPDARQDLDDLFGPAPAPKPAPTAAVGAKYAKKEEPDQADEPATFYQLAPLAIAEHGLADLVNELVRAPGSWIEKTARLQAAMGV